MNTSRAVKSQIAEWEADKAALERGELDEATV